MKHTVRIIIATTVMGLSAKALAVMPLGEGTELLLTASGSVFFDDNIYLNPSKEKSDTIYSLTPGLDLVFGKGSATQGNVYYSEEFRRFASHSAQNVNLANVGTSVAYSNGVSKADFNASYKQVAQNDNIAKASGDIVRRNLTALGASGEVAATGKTKIGGGLAYAKTDYLPSTYTDNETITLPVDVYYEASPKLDWSLGYQYRDTKLSGTAGSSSKDSFFSLGARGEFDPKLTGQIRLGYTQRSFDKAGYKNASLLGANGKLTYAYSEKTSLVFNISNDFGNSGFGDSTKNFNVGLSANSRITEQWFVNAEISSTSLKYATRTDTYVQEQIGITYTYNQIVSFGGSLTHRNNSSDLASAKFANTVFNFGVNVRY